MGFKWSNPDFKDHYAGTILAIFFFILM